MRRSPWRSTTACNWQSLTCGKNGPLCCTNPFFLARHGGRDPREGRRGLSRGRTVKVMERQRRYRPWSADRIGLSPLHLSISPSLPLSLSPSLSLPPSLLPYPPSSPSQRCFFPSSRPAASFSSGLCRCALFMRVYTLVFPFLVLRPDMFPLHHSFTPSTLCPVLVQSHFWPSFPSIHGESPVWLLH